MEIDFTGITKEPFFAGLLTSAEIAFTTGMDPEDRIHIHAQPL
jgi:hypothetical protein